MANGTDTKIDTQLFVATADSISKTTGELETCFSEWGKVTQGLRGAWQGDTSDNIKNTVDAVQKSAGNLLRTLGGYKATLHELAGIYDKTEKSVQETGKSLKFDSPMR
ncbi:MAG: WXG100 family type VII secretion target [Oscillospiraceae bacterium]|nr:WXG100 family type VII secretion target [Oscillospiraceae bacterium]